MERKQTPRGNEAPQDLGGILTQRGAGQLINDDCSSKLCHPLAQPIPEHLGGWQGQEDKWVTQPPDIHLPKAVKEFKNRPNTLAADDALSFIANLP